MRLDNPVLIGGSPSCGSTLLAAIVNSHPDIACGPEMSVFNKRVIYGNWERVQARLPIWLKKGCPTDGYAVYAAFFRRRDDYHVSETQLIEWTRDAPSLRSFVERFERHVLHEQGKARFAEKTPSNVYCFREFVDLFPTGRVVHLVRDGRDVVCSLMRRGMTLFQASSHWLYNTSAGIACRQLPQYLEMRYEDLVTNPSRVVQTLCQHLEIDFTAQMLRRQSGDAGRSGLSTWRSSPMGPITSASIGQYHEALTDAQLARFYGVGLTHHATAKLQAGQNWTTKDLLSSLGYRVDPYPDPSCGLSTLPEALADQLRRNKHSLRHRRRIAWPLTWVSR